MMHAIARRFLVPCVLSLLASANTAVAGAIVDVPLPVFDTKIVIASTTGKMLWLDSKTLAITTYVKDAEYWDGKVVAVNVAAKSTVTIVERGFLQCARQGGLVGILKGSHVRMFKGAEAAGDTPEPVRAFYRWNSNVGKLEAEQPAPKPPWNWFLCMRTQAADADRPEMGFYGRNVRYLDAMDGVLRLEGDGPPENSGRVVLATAKKLSRVVDVVSGDIALVPEFLAFRDSYLLTSGQFMIGSYTKNNLGKETDELPAIVMTRYGRVSRLLVPPKFKTELVRLQSSGGQTRPTAAGLLVHASGRAGHGGGLFLADADPAKRIWCTPGPNTERDCRIESWQLSPDGCNIAFVPYSDYPKTVKVMNLCLGKGRQ